jgi:hypothetical protein
MFQRKNLVIVQPDHMNDSKLGQQNEKLFNKIKGAPPGVDTRKPYTQDLMDISAHTAPRNARLEREFNQSMLVSKTKSDQRVTDN